MVIRSVRVRNFRAIKDAELRCDALTALVGANGVGKSSFLHALRLFYSQAPKLDADDFYNQDTAAEISIAVCFTDLSAAARDLMAAYVQGDTLTVERVFTLDEGKVTAKYHGASLQHEGFRELRETLATRGAREARRVYDGLRQRPEYADLPPWTNVSEVAGALSAWEAANPDQCVRQRDDGQFFGFKEVAAGYLGRFTRFLFVPAVRDAAEDAAEGRGSLLTELVDLVVRSALAQKQELHALRADVQSRYKEIMDPARLPELCDLSSEMTATLKAFVPDASVDLRWQPVDQLDIPLPRTDVRLVEDGYSSPVARTGHGLQRAFILTMLQQLAAAQQNAARAAEPGQESSRTDTAGEAGSGAGERVAPSGNVGESEVPDLVLAIEEPELYQHPNRQRHIARILRDLSTGRTPGVAERTQVLYTTHSPLFVGVDRVDQIRLLRKDPGKPGEPKVTRVVSTDLDQVAKAVWKAEGEPDGTFNAQTIRPRLQSIMTPFTSEGFFAEVAVLVEGEDDRAAIMGVAQAMDCDLEREGISVIPCGGKTNLDRPAIIFSQLGVPVYLVWDADKGDKSARPEDNHRLLRLMEQPVVDWPCQVHDRFACFAVDLETTLRDEIGAADFERLLQKCQDSLHIPKRKHAVKNPVVITTIVREAADKGHRSPTLETIIAKIVALRPRTVDGSL